MSELTGGAGRKHEVRYDLSWTKNMGNYESLKVNLGLSLDGTGNPDATLAKVRTWVEENLATAVQDVSEAIEGK